MVWGSGAMLWAVRVCLASPCHSWKDFSSMQGWESRITALDGKVGREVQRFLSSALSLTLLPWVSVYMKFLCWPIFRSPVAAGSTFSSKYKKVHFVGGLILFTCLPPSDHSTDMDRISSHLTCEKGHVLFGLGHSSFCTCVKNHFSCIWSLQPFGLCSPPGFSVIGILQARLMKRVAMPSFRGSSLLRDQTHISGLLHLQSSSLPLAPPGKLILVSTY